MTQDELTLVLEALKWCHGGEPCGTAEAIAVIEKALAQHDSVQAKPEPEHEPVKVLHKHEWFRTNEMKVGQMRCISCGVWGQEETPQRTWVGLTDEEVWEMDAYKMALTDQETRWLYRFARAIEAKLKEKNT